MSWETMIKEHCSTEAPWCDTCKMTQSQDMAEQVGKHGGQRQQPTWGHRRGPTWHEAGASQAPNTEARNTYVLTGRSDKARGYKVRDKPSWERWFLSGEGALPRGRQLSWFWRWNLLDGGEGRGERSRGSPGRGLLGRVWGWLEALWGQLWGLKRSSSIIMITYNRNYYDSLLIIFNIKVLNNIKHLLKVYCVPKTLIDISPSFSRCHPHFILQLLKPRPWEVKWLSHGHIIWDPHESLCHIIWKCICE